MYPRLDYPHPLSSTSPILGLQLYTTTPGKTEYLNTFSIHLCYWITWSTTNLTQDAILNLFRKAWTALLANDKLSCPLFTIPSAFFKMPYAFGVNFTCYTLKYSL